MSDVQLLPTEAELDYTFNFSDDVVAPVTLASIVITVPLPLTKGTQQDDLANAKTIVIIKGAVHGERYMGQAIGTLSNGVKITKDAIFIGFNGA
jgi:hypothetical protein